MKVRVANKVGYVECIGGGIADLSYPTSTTRRGRVIDGGRVCPTIMTSGDLCRMNNEYSIYRLTPREYWRLMDFDDDDYEKAAEVVTETQLYKQAGNSIVVNVLTAIFGQMFEGKESVYII